jgi:FkbM family methyltransferase
MSFTRLLRRHFPRLWFLSEFFKYKYRKGEPELRVLGKLAPRDKIALDVGSSIGFYARELARFATKVVAFEANPATAAFARTVAKRNVQIVNVALSAREGRVALRIPVDARNQPMDELGTVATATGVRHDNTISIEIPAQRLDDFDLPSCGFIKIDAEGHEESVLDGAARLIAKHRPILMLELMESINPGCIGRVSERLSRLSYAGYFLSRGRLLAMAEFNSSRQQSFEEFAKLSVLERQRVEHIINFFFIPEETAPTIIARFK